MLLRQYRTADCPELLRLFYDAVHTVAGNVYTQSQLDVWATGREDAEAWDRSLRAHYCLVAMEGDRIVGFGDLAEPGYLYRLYVHRQYQGRGIATALCRGLEAQATGDCLFTHASINARGFFEKQGYQTAACREFRRGGVFLAHYIMVKPLLRGGR